MTQDTKTLNALRLILDTLVTDQKNLDTLNDLYSKIKPPLDHDQNFMTIYTKLSLILPGDPYDLYMSNILTLRGYINSHDDIHDSVYVVLLGIINNMFNSAVNSNIKSQKVIQNTYLSHLIFYYILNPVEYKFDRGSTSIPPPFDFDKYPDGVIPEEGSTSITVKNMLTGIQFTIDTIVPDDINSSKLAEINDLYHNLNSTNPFYDNNIRLIMNALMKLLPAYSYNVYKQNILVLKNRIELNTISNRDIQTELSRAKTEFTDAIGQFGTPNQPNSIHERDYGAFQKLYVRYLMLYYTITPVKYFFHHGSSSVPPVFDYEKYPDGQVPKGKNPFKQSDHQPDPQPDPQSDHQPDPQPDPQPDSQSDQKDSQPDTQKDPSESTSYIKWISLILLIVIILVFIYLKFIK